MKPIKVLFRQAYGRSEDLQGITFQVGLKEYIVSMWGKDWDDWNADWTLDIDRQGLKLSGGLVSEIRRKGLVRDIKKMLKFAMKDYKYNCDWERFNRSRTASL